MKYIVIRTETNTTTEVYEVEVEPIERGFPTNEDLAVRATIHSQPVGSYPTRTVKFEIMKKLREGT